MEMTIPVILPFVDPDTKNGFFINLTSQLVTCAFGIIIIPVGEQVTVVIKNNILAAAAMIDSDITTLKKSLELDEEYNTLWILRNCFVGNISFSQCF